MVAKMAVMRVEMRVAWLVVLKGLLSVDLTVDKMAAEMAAK